MPAEPKAGDLYYLRTEEGYQVCKILRIDVRPVDNQPPFVVQHVLVYKPLPNPPTPEDVSALEIKIWHAPMAPEHESQNEKRIYFANASVTDSDLEGYRSYLEVMRNGEIDDAVAAYKRGCALQDEGKHREAMSAYGEAIEILPSFVEALDNRGISKEADLLVVLSLLASALA
jgi:tetratricopeptide (TPR) repeat protein